MTPSSALRSITRRQMSEPPSAIGISSPSANVRWTMYHGISTSSSRGLDRGLEGMSGHDLMHREYSPC